MFTFAKICFLAKLLSLFLGVAVLCSVELLTAQDAPGIRHFAPGDYGGQNQNWAIAQAAGSGRVYVANNGGLLSFDGSRWLRHTLPLGQTPRCVALGANDTVFCGGFAEFGAWSRLPNGNWAFQSLCDASCSELFAREEIWNITSVPGSVLFQSFSTLYRYAQGKVTALRPPGAIMFAQAIDGRILVPVIGLGLFELLADNTFRLLPGSGALGGHIVQFLAPGPDGAIWIGTAEAGLYVWKHGQCAPWDDPLNQRFRQAQLNRCTALRQGGWALGTVTDGVYILDAAGKLRFHLHRANGLQNNTVLALMEDRDGQLWLGLDKGIDLVMLRAPLRYFTDQEGGMGTVYTAAQHQGLLYVGTNQGLYARTGNGPFRLIEGTQGQVWDLGVYGGQLLCGHNAGTFWVDGQVARKISSVTGGWCIRPIPDRPDRLLQSTYTGLVVFQKNRGNWSLSHKIAGIEGPFRSIAFDENGYLWGANANRGLVRFRLDEDLTRAVELKTFSQEHGLPSDFHLNLDTFQHQLLLNGGNTCFTLAQTPQGPHFKPFAESKVLPGVGGDLFRVEAGKVTWQHNHGSHLLPFSLVPDYENVRVLPDGRYLFCLENGFATMPRDTVAAWLECSAPLWVEASPLEGPPLPHNTVYELPHNASTLVFRFAQSCFARAPRYAWRLDGLSEDWSAWQTEPEVRLLNLPSGNYVFRVKSQSSETEAQLAFKIAPPWYRSGWAFVMYGMVLVLGIYGVEAFNRRRLSHQKALLDAEKERELEHQRAIAERSRLALELESKNRELSNAAINLIRKNEALRHLKEALETVPAPPKSLQPLIRQIDQHMEGDHDWAVFEETFNQVHDDFFKRLMAEYPDITQGDLRLAAYLRLNLSSKEIAPLLNLSLRGVENKRYRLRKKLGLPDSENLTEFILKF